MITREDFYKIEGEVEKAVVELFDTIKKNNKDGYLLYLANAEYNHSYKNTGLSQYVVSSNIDMSKEFGRIYFAYHFLNIHYSFAKDAPELTDDELRLHIELLIYCHVWESTKYLKQLYRAEELVNKKSYPWKVDVIPESSKHFVIRDVIRDGFKGAGLVIADIMTNGFHTSIRNSFSHSEYEIDWKAKIINLNTYRVGKKGKHEIDEITFDDWTRKFIYTVLLSYKIYTEKDKRRNSVYKDFKNDKFLIIHPINDNAFRATNIYYDESRSSFSFHKSETPYKPTKDIKNDPPFKRILSTLIQREKFNEMWRRTGDAIAEVFDLLEYKFNDEYILLIHNVEYNVISQQYTWYNSIDDRRDKGRYNFSGNLLSTVYDYDREKIDIEELIRLPLELMVYCHIWESKPFLKRLYRIKEIVSGAGYIWDFIVPNETRDEFIIEDIAKGLGKHKLYISDIIQQSFHSSLRNAFAHVDYEIYLKEDLIILDTYKPDKINDIDHISLKDWAIKFLYSVFLDYRISDEIVKRRQGLKKLSLRRIQDITQKQENVK